MEVLLFLLLPLAVGACIFLVGGSILSARQPARQRRTYHLGTSSTEERLLLWSSLPSALVALIVLAFPPLDQLAPAWLGSILDRICEIAPPTFWCLKMPRPVPWLITIHAVAYLPFVVASVRLVILVWTGRLPKPQKYVEGSLPILTQLLLAAFWLFVAAGGQFLVPPKLMYVSIYAGLAWSLGYLCFALCALRFVAIALKYRRPPIRA